jgi:hypothetical protein
MRVGRLQVLNRDKCLAGIISMGDLAVIWAHCSERHLRTGPAALPAWWTAALTVRDLTFEGRGRYACLPRSAEAEAMPVQDLKFQDRANARQGFAEAAGLPQTRASPPLRERVQH